MEQFSIARYSDALGKARRSYARFLEPVCRAWSLTRCEVDILLFLYNNPSFDRAADIVEHRGIAKSHVSLGVGSLTERALLERSGPQGDRRATHLKLTQAGEKIARQAHAVQREYFSRIFAGVSEEELALWQSMIDRVCDNLDSV